MASSGNEAADEEANDAADCVLIASGDADDALDDLVLGSGVTPMDVVDGCSVVASLLRTRIIMVLLGSVPVSFIIYGSLFATPYAL